MTEPVAHGSIRLRLLVSLMIGAAVLSILLYFVVQTLTRQVAQESQDNVLAASALSILDSARFAGGQTNLDLPYSALSMLDSVTDERVFYAISLENEFLSGYADLPFANSTEAGRPSFLSTTFLGEEVRVATVRRSVSTDIGQNFLQVSVAQTTSGQNQTLARISRMSLGIGAGFFALSVLLAAIISRSTIRPLYVLTTSVSRRGPKDLRPVAAPVPSEMVPLVASLNSFMRRLQNSLSRSEDFIAEAAHRVRTPLAIVRTKAEIIQRKTDDRETAAAVREMIHAIDDSSRTAGQLLDHAMVTFRLDHLSEEEIDLAQLVRDTVSRLRPLSELKDIELSMSRLDHAKLHGDPILLQNALHNLLDNAIKYSPVGATVDITVHAKPEGKTLSIRDTGPGYPKADAAELIGRFTRGSNAGEVVGSGLGLTIVKEVVEAHGGRLELGHNSGGGACATLFFPSS